MNYIEIPKWEEFQHYKHRDPSWIKCYVRLLSNDDYLGLTGPQRGILHGLWMLYAKSGRKVPENTAKLSRKLGLRVTKRSLEALRDAGFIEIVASTLLDQRREEESRKTLASTREKEPVGVLDQLQELRKAHQRREEPNGVSEAFVI